MKLQFILEGEHDNARSHTLHSMRQLMLAGGSAPMNVDLFYDQFFNPENLSGVAKEKIEKVKKSWNSVADEFVVFLDYGMTDSLVRNVSFVENLPLSKTVKYHFLECNQVNDMYKNVKGYFSSQATYQSTVDFTSRNASKYIEENKLHEHLPEHFKTYFNEIFSQIDDDTIPEHFERVIFESPFAGDIESNTEYAAKCIAELIMNHNKAPMASHLLYTRMLNDFVESERNLGIDAGLEYGRHAERTMIAIDRGLSTGMKYGVLNAIKANRPLTVFSISTDEKVQQAVAQLKTLEDIESWIDKQKEDNKELFEKTGYITNVCVPQKDQKKLKLSL